ncbi:MAG TPA: hypothetical protein VFG73_07380 [Rhodanobacteraceae bacterium]|nr:hypothetical protein [Rhodanobacteraceae bacterium]
MAGLLVACAAPCAQAGSLGLGLSGSAALTQGDSSERVDADRSRGDGAASDDAAGDILTGDAGAPAVGGYTKQPPAATPSAAATPDSGRVLPGDRPRKHHTSSWQSLLPGSIQ